MTTAGADVVALPVDGRHYQGRLTEAIRGAINDSSQEWPLTYIDILGALQVVTYQIMSEMEGPE